MKTLEFVESVLHFTAHGYLADLIENLYGWKGLRASRFQSRLMHMAGQGFSGGVVVPDGLDTSLREVLGFQPRGKTEMQHFKTLFETVRQEEGQAKLRAWVAEQREMGRAVSADVPEELKPVTRSAGMMEQLTESDEQLARQLGA